MYLNKVSHRNFKDKYKEVSVVLNVSNIVKWCVFRELYSSLDEFFWKHQCGFRKSYNMQYCLLVMLDKQKLENDKITSFGALLTYRIDLLTVTLAFDCLFPKLLLANLQAYGFSTVALKLVCSYLTNNR